MKGKNIYIIKYKLYVFKKHLILFLLTIQSLKQMRYRYISKIGCCTSFANFFYAFFLQHFPTILHNMSF